MNKVFSGRLVFVLFVTVLSLWFIYPTAKYFSFVSGLPEEPTVEQTKQKQEMLSQSSMIKLGLDLQGGVDFLIELDVDKMFRQKIEELADGLREDFRNEVQGTVELDPEKNEIHVTVTKVEDLLIAKDIIDRYEASLTPDDITNLDGGMVTLTMNKEDRASLINDAFEAAYKTINDRVDAFGLTQPEVTKQKNAHRIGVKVPGETDPERIRKSLLKTAVLEFRLLHPNHDELITNFVKPGTQVFRDEFLEEVPSDEVVGAMVTRVKKGIPGVPPGYQLYMGEDTRTSDDGELIRTPNIAYILKQKASLTGANLRKASYFRDFQDLRNPNKVSLEFDKEGTEKFAEITKDNIGRRFAMALDGKVVSAPVIQSAILEGRAVIEGNFTEDECVDLSNVLKAGSLPAPLKIVNEQTVGASLGQDSIIDSLKALLIGGIFLVIMMVFIYRTSGAIAIIATILNVLLIMAVLAMADATLTLSGIGGILLTMGMAVDANVLIYEHLREELHEGKPLKGALNAAFGRAFTVILDSNVTTLLPAIVLILFEVVEGSVKGFWTALGIGLIANLYTGLAVTRALMEAWVVKRKAISVGTWKPFDNSKFDFMTFRKICYPISGAIVGLSLVYLVLHGVNPGIDFTGGVMANVEARSAEVTRPALESALKVEFADAKVVKILNKDMFQVTVPNPEDSHGLSDAEIMSQIQTDLKGILTQNFGDQAGIESMQSVSSVVGDEFKVTAFWTILVASLIILGYIAMRFRPIFGLGAVAALVHDLIIALGLFVIMGHSLTLDIVSALLIILGYSVNDTIVVFDRIRESMSEMYGKSMGEIINFSINKTLSRTVFTSGTTLITIISMLLFGGVGLKDFALILLIGIAVGTYSSIFVASALVCSFITIKEKREGIAKAHGKTKTVKITA